MGNVLKVHNCNETLFKLLFRLFFLCELIENTTFQKFALFRASSKLDTKENLLCWDPQYSHS
jgi:hypothetical protein